MEHTETTRALSIPIGLPRVDAALAGAPELAAMGAERLLLRRHFLPVWDDEAYDMVPGVGPLRSPDLG
ncbi:MAG: hypothetical protein ACYC3S_05570 [Chloroflexota bacterium]